MNIFVEVKVVRCSGVCEDAVPEYEDCLQYGEQVVLKEEGE